MKNRLSDFSIKKIFNVIKPWIFYIGLFLILRFTGLISYVSTVTQQALFKTGVLDASVNTELDVAAKKFDYSFSVYDLNKNKLDVSTLKGKTLFINLWATWCGPCRVEMPSIQNLYNSADKDKVVFIMLALDQKDPYNKVASYIDDKKFSFPVYLPGSRLPDLLQVKSIPTTFVVNPEGTIVLKETGAANYDTEEFRNFLIKHSAPTPQQAP
jgi:thiol-disulfide isomerase/thioredoxin